MIVALSVSTLTLFTPRSDSLKPPAPSPLTSYTTMAAVVDQKEGKADTVDFADSLSLNEKAHSIDSLDEVEDSVSFFSYPALLHTYIPLHCQQQQQQQQQCPNSNFYLSFSLSPKSERLSLQQMTPPSLQRPSVRGSSASSSLWSWPL